MATKNYEKYDDSFFPLNEMFEGVSESNYLQYAQISFIQQEHQRLSFCKLEGQFWESS